MMVFGNSYVLPSTGPDMLERKSSALVVDSRSQSNLNSAQVVTKSTPRIDFPSMPYHCELDIRKRTAHAALKIRERRQRSQNLTHISRDPIFTNAELQSERYNVYREKQRGNPKKPQEEQVWTDELERIFQLGGFGRISCTPTPYTNCTTALRKIPNLGRKKTPCDPQQCGGSATKPRGRNEHISHFISRHTGVERKRKQISSHIQVLKGFQKDNDRCKKYQFSVSILAGLNGDHVFILGMALVAKPETDHAYGSHVQHIYHSFPPIRSQTQIPTSFPCTNIATPAPTDDCSWGFIPSPATPPIPDYRSFLSSTSSGASCTSASSLRHPSPPPTHENYYASQSQPHQHNQTYHQNVDMGRLEYQFLSPIPAPPPLHPQLNYSSWQPTASGSALGLGLVQGQVTPPVESPAAHRVPQWSGDHIELLRFEDRRAGCDAGVEAVKTEQIAEKRDRLPCAVESGANGEAYWKVAERRW